MIGIGLYESEEAAVADLSLARQCESRNLVAGLYSGCSDVRCSISGHGATPFHQNHISDSWIALTSSREVKLFMNATLLQ